MKGYVMKRSVKKAETAKGNSSPIYWYRSGIVSTGRSSSQAMELIFHPVAVLMYCIDMMPRPSKSAPLLFPYFSWVLERWATFPKISVISVVSTSLK